MLLLGIALLALQDQAATFEGLTQEQWVAQLKDLSPAVRVKAVRALPSFGPSALPSIATALEDADVRVHESAAMAMARISRDAGHEALPYLEKAASSPIPHVCAAGINILSGHGKDGMRTIVKAWETQLETRQPMCSGGGGYWPVNSLSRVLEELKKNGELGRPDPTLLKLLLDSLKLPDQQVKMGALNAILVFGPSAASALPAVQPLEKDPDEKVRGRAKAAIAALRGK